MTQIQQFQQPINLANIGLPSSGTFFEHEGFYKMIVCGAAFKAAKANQNNVMLALTLQIVEGEHTGARGTLNLNLYNTNPDAVKIAYEELNALAHACGADPVLSSPAQLINKPFCAYISVSNETSKTDPNKSFTNNSYSQWSYANGEPIVRGQYGIPAAQAQGQYATPTAAPAPVAAPAAPTAAPVAAPVAAPSPTTAPVAAPAAPTAAPAPTASPSFAPPAGGAPFAVPQ